MVEWRIPLLSATVAPPPGRRCEASRGGPGDGCATDRGTGSGTGFGPPRPPDAVPCAIAHALQACGLRLPDPGGGFPTVVSGAAVSVERIEKELGLIASHLDAGRFPGSWFAESTEQPWIAYRSAAERCAWRCHGLGNGTGIWLSGRQPPPTGGGRRRSARTDFPRCRL